MTKLLPGWAIHHNQWDLFERPSTTLWSDGKGISVARVASGAYRLQFVDLASITVDSAAKTIHVHACGQEVPPSTFDHLLFDQILPRIRSHLGQLVIHAAAIASEGSSILLLGPSGRGKSTLAASLPELGCTLLGDDAVHLAPDRRQVLAAAIYPSLRLLPDSIAALFGTSRLTTETAHYTFKRRVAPTGPAPDETPVPVAAMFVLGAAGDEIAIRRLSPAETCVELLRESFALDPSDVTRAAKRMAQAGKVAERVPAYVASYPRDYLRLPEVGRALLDTAKVHA